MTDAIAAGNTVAGWSLAWQRALPQRSPDEQRELIARAVQAATALQSAARRESGPGRALHHRCLYATDAATFTITEEVPESIALGPLRPRSVWPATVRISSASPFSRTDEVPDQRGFAVRLTSDNRRIDFLATTGEAHHARDALAAIASLEAVARTTRPGISGKLRALAHLVRRLGLREGVGVARGVSAASQAGASLASLTYYSRAPFQLGPHAVRFRFCPSHPGAVALLASGANALTADLAARTRHGEEGVSWEFQLQGFIDSARTPMDDHRVAWDSPWLTIARLALPPSTEAGNSADLGRRESQAAATAFDVSPGWPDERGAVFVPLGDLNALRAAVYAASAAGRARDP